MAQTVKRIRLDPSTDRVRMLGEVHEDKALRMVERDGAPLAVVISAEDYRATIEEPKSTRLKSRLLSFAGVWRDLHGDRTMATA